MTLLADCINAVVSVSNRPFDEPSFIDNFLAFVHTTKLHKHLPTALSEEINVQLTPSTIKKFLRWAHAMIKFLLKNVPEQAFFLDEDGLQPIHRLEWDGDTNNHNTSMLIVCELINAHDAVDFKGEKSQEVAIAFVDRIVFSDRIYPDHCYIAAVKMIQRYRINILDYKQDLRHDAVFNEFLRSRYSPERYVKFARLILSGVNLGYFEASSKKNEIFNRIAHHAIYELVAGSSEQVACIAATLQLSKLGVLEIQRKPSLREMDFPRALLKIGVELSAFKNFSELELQDPWRVNTPKHETPKIW